MIFFGNRSISEGNATNRMYPTMMHPMFLKFLDSTYARFFGFADKNPELENKLLPGFCKGDMFLYSNITGNISRKPIGWRCIADTSPEYQNGQWEEIHNLKPAEPSPDISSSATLADVIADINDLKAKLRIAGLLKP